MSKVGITKEEKQLSYYRFFEQELAPVPEEKLAIARSKASDVPAVTMAERNKFLAGTDTDCCQVGYGIMPDGTAFVCNTTYMPGVTAAMMDWWFPWHGVGSDLRYKIWDPEDHYFAKADDAKRLCDSSIPMNERMWGVTDYLIEDVGSGPAPLILHFKGPREMGFDESLIGSETCTSFCAAIGDGDCAAVMTHKWYTHEDGIMFCSRFWIGYTQDKEGRFVSLLPAGAKVPLEVPQGLFAHNIKEFTNLAAILPAVYAENKDNF